MVLEREMSTRPTDMTPPSTIMMESPRKKHLVQEFNSVFSCKLCNGYLIDATTLLECGHSFCRACIIRHFENTKTQIQCPVCPVLYKKKSHCFGLDTQLQALVYKSVPSLYFKEMQRREDFYRSTGVRAGSSCSDDSVIDQERDLIQESEKMISECVGDRSQYLNQDELMSLSLEYYQLHLDTTDVVKNSENTNTESVVALNNKNISDGKKVNGQLINNNNSEQKNAVLTNWDQRFLQCPAGVNMKHLQKFVRMKYGLSSDYRVDIIYKGEVLPHNFNLMDVAYTFQWKKIKPMRFFYRIFTPLKIRPIKIVQTPTPTGGKQLQIVPIHTNVRPESIVESSTCLINSFKEATESEQQDKERLLANLQLQSKSKALQIAEAKRKMHQEKLIKECVFEYEEPDQEEIKRFAEKRDREWALQKKMEEDMKADKNDYFLAGYPSSTKKRKRNKHSKNDSTGHKEKKRKLHAEITNNDKSDLKLKVKITTNGHKHKHHKIENGLDVSSKAKLLEMRRIRHKHLSGSSGDEKNQPTIPIIKLTKFQVANYLEEPEMKKKKVEFCNINDNNNKTPNEDSQTRLKVEPMVIKSSLNNSKPLPRSLPHQTSANNPKIMRKDLSVKFSHQKPVFKEQPSSKVQIKNDTAKKSTSSGSAVMRKILPVGSITTNDKILDRKLVSLQQRCTIEPKNSTNNNNNNNNIRINNEKNNINHQYPRDFTVSKIENGEIKRKSVDCASSGHHHQDQRPSLEITLIPPSSTSAAPSSITKSVEMKPIAKRPPPGTIPLEKIKNSVNLKSGISIIPKMPDRNTNSADLSAGGVLDLSKQTKFVENLSKSEPINGLNSMIKRQINNLTPILLNSSCAAAVPNKSTVNMPPLANLHMLSKVASEHPTLNKLSSNTNNNNNAKTRPQIPNLQTIGNISGTAIPISKRRLPPELLNVIKQKFRSGPINSTIRGIRPPNQNQNIRNIPNPSLIYNRHQVNNNNSVPNGYSAITEKKIATPKQSPSSSSTSNQHQKASVSTSSVTSSTNNSVSTNKEVSAIISKSVSLLEQKIINQPSSDSKNEASN